MGLELQCWCETRAASLYMRDMPIVSNEHEVTRRGIKLAASSHLPDTYMHVHVYPWSRTRSTDSYAGPRLYWPVALVHGISITSKLFLVLLLTAATAASECSQPDKPVDLLQSFDSRQKYFVLVSVGQHEPPFIRQYMDSCSYMLNNTCSHGKFATGWETIAPKRHSLHHRTAQNTN